MATHPEETGLAVAEVGVVTTVGIVEVAIVVIAEATTEVIAGATTEVIASVSTAIGTRK